MLWGWSQCYHAGMQPPLGATRLQSMIGNLKWRHVGGEKAATAEVETLHPTGHRAPIFYQVPSTPLVSLFERRRSKQKQPNKSWCSCEKAASPSKAGHAERHVVFSTSRVLVDKRVCPCCIFRWAVLTVSLICLSPVSTVTRLVIFIDGVFALKMGFAGKGSGNV
eukprot:5601771-Amphidinium_carterae.1